MSTDQSTNLGLPFLMPAQAQKHVTVNESLLRLDALVQASVESRSVSSQPGSPADGALWILPAGKTGPEWGGYTNGRLAYYRDGSWESIAPREGWRVWVKDEDALVRYDGAAWTADAAVGSLNSGPLAGLRNALINGGFDVWQRGTSFAPAGSAYGPDRWHCAIPTGHTFTRQTGFSGARYSLRMARDNGSSNTSDKAVAQRIESHIARQLAGRTVRISFDARRGSGFAADPSLSWTVRTGTAEDETGATHSAAYTTGAATPGSGSVTVTTTAQRFSVGPVTLGSTIGELLLAFHHASTGTASANDYIEIANIQLEIGGLATPFELRPAALEQAMCRRYYERLGLAATVMATGWVYASTVGIMSLAFTPKRATPTFSSSGSFSVYDGSSAQAVTSLTANTIGPDRLELDAAVASGLTVGRGCGLLAGSSSCYVALDSEL